jgi:hypothetical protein
MPKYVVSSTLTDPQWADTTVLSGDVAAAVGELKAKPGGELQVHGSGNLVRWLVDNHLVDEITLLTYPVVIGQGTRLFPATGPDTALELVDSQSTPKGVSIQVYRPTGRPQYATATADLKQDRCRIQRESLIGGCGLQRRPLGSAGRCERRSSGGSALASAARW